MTETIYTVNHRTPAQAAHGVPVVQIHHVRRDVHGNSIAIKVYGELKIAAKEIIYARELKLNTIQTLLLTTKTGYHALFHPQKWIYNEGEYDNYASIDIFSCDAYEMLAGTRGQSAETAPAALPEDGSIWLDFEAIGE